MFTLTSATALSLWMGVPQARHLWSTRDATGLTSTQDLVRVLALLAWVVYGTVTSNVGMVASHAVMVTPSLVILILLVRLGRIRTWRGLILPAALVGTATAALVGSGHGILLGSFAAAADIFRYLPQTWRTLKVGSLAGVAPATYSALAVCATLWCVYGLLVSATPLAVSMAVQVPLAAVIWVRVTADHRRQAVTGGP